MAVPFKPAPELRKSTYRRAFTRHALEPETRPWNPATDQRLVDLPLRPVWSHDDDDDALELRIKGDAIIVILLDDDTERRALLDDESNLVGWASALGYGFRVRGTVAAAKPVNL
jgi:hypothetical protein